MTIMVRGYGNGRLLFEEPVNADESELAAIAEAQIRRVVEFERNMIEIEFLDEPNQQDRFFRFGSDPRGMVMLIEIKARA